MSLSGVHIAAKPVREAFFVKREAQRATAGKGMTLHEERFTNDAPELRVVSTHIVLQCEVDR